MADLPDAFIKRMRERLGPGIDAFAAALEQPAPVSIRYNPAKVSAPDGDAVPWCKWGRYLGQRPSFTLDPVFQGGGYYVQEASSMLLEQAVTQYVDLGGPQVALDLCASPGGKSTHLLSLLLPDSLLVSNEAVRGRTSALLDNLQSWGYDNVIVTNNDPKDFGRLPNFFDLIVADAPCSGEGLFRKDAAAREEWSERSVELCSLRQRRILMDVWAALRPGGLFVYSTCTYNDQENRINLEWLVSETSAESLPLRLDPTWGIETIGSDFVHGYQCFPHKVRGEGFFIAVLRKSGDEPRRTPASKNVLRAPSTDDSNKVSGWLKNPDKASFFTHGTQLRSIPQRYRQEFAACLSSLHVLRAGLGIGELTRNKVVPDHSLALSACRGGSLGHVSVDKSQALAFLRRENLSLQAETGFHVVEFEGIGLGWVNVLPGRVNNLLPANRRIRLDDPKL